METTTNFFAARQGFGSGFFWRSHPIDSLYFFENSMSKKKTIVILSNMENNFL